MAQVPVHCELCDSEDCVDFYCVTCAETLCKRCKETHSRSRKTKNDQIIALSEARQQNLKSAKMSSFCSVHPSLELNLYCSKCDELICLECLDGKQGDHKSYLQTVTKFASEKKEKLVNAKKLLMERKTHFEKATINERKVHNQFSESVDKCKKDILEQKSKIIKELDNICDQHFAELSVLQEEEDNRYSKSCTNINSESQAVILALESVQSGIDTEDPATILQATKDVAQALKRRKESTSKLPQLSMPSFNPLEINNQGLSDQLGTLNKRNQEKKQIQQTVVKVSKETNLPEEVTDEVKQKSTRHSKEKQQKGKSIKQQIDLEVKNVTWKSSICVTGKKNIRVVVPMENNTMWIAADDDKHLTLVNNLSGNVILESVTIDGHIADAVRYTKCLLITCNDGDKVIKMVSNGKSTSVFADFSPDYWTGGLCVTHDMDVLVCLQSASEPSKVVRLNETGDVIQSIQEDHTGASLFNLPERITSLSTGEIVVTDPNADRILCVDREGELLFMWNEEVPGVQPEYKYNYKLSGHLWHITHDRYNNLFITDGQKMFVLTKDTTGAKCLMKETYCQAGTVDNKGYLWYAGYDSYLDGNNKVYRYFISH